MHVHPLLDPKDREVHKRGDGNKVQKRRQNTSRAVFGEVLRIPSRLAIFYRAIIALYDESIVVGVGTLGFSLLQVVHVASFLTFHEKGEFVRLASGCWFGVELLCHWGVSGCE